MQEESNHFEALNLISDWAKWLVAIQTGLIALFCTLFTSEQSPASIVSKLLATAAIICFLFSISTASMLLLTLPDIIQDLKPRQNIWKTYDEVALRKLGLNTQRFAILEAVFFGSGLIFSVIMLITVIWE